MCVKSAELYIKKPKKVGLSIKLFCIFQFFSTISNSNLPSNKDEFLLKKKKV
jgi:hypothetical protein